MPTAQPVRPRNRLLAQLPAAEFHRLEEWLKPIKLPVRYPIFKPAGNIDYVYFLESGVASAVAYVANGASIEVATVGNEGMLGVPALLAAAASPNEVYMQVAGHGLQMPSAALRKLAGVGTPIYETLSKYLAAYLFQISQAVACNGLHAIKQRCCRWLLMTHDRVGTDELQLTHEFLGIMLGVRRASVTEVLQPLQDSGLIGAQRGVITIRDRPGLQEQSCECYRLVADEYVRLLG